MFSLELWEIHQQAQFLFLAMLKVYEAAISETVETAGKEFCELEWDS